MNLRLDSPLQYLKGVGPKLAEIFRKRELVTVQDLLEFYPRTYEDRRAIRNIASLQANELVSLKAQIISIQSFGLGRGPRKVHEVLLGDSSGRIKGRYFRVPYRGYFERFRPFQDVLVVGKVSEYRGRLEFHHPDIRDLDPEAEVQDGILPVYVEIDGLSSVKIQRLILSALEQLNGEVPETLPPDVIREFQLLSRYEALQEIHNPKIDESQKFLDRKSRAQQRVIFEELFWLELYLAAKKRGFKSESAARFWISQGQQEEILSKMPFPLTGAQRRTLEDIRRDLNSGSPMHRLVQGDVGSGKTLVAFLSAWIVQTGQGQSCLMAPTEILAEQHFKNATKILPLRVELLTGKTKASERARILDGLSQGEVDLLIGTHALLEDPVKFRNLGLVVIDEQHRFGVQQRSLLKQKGFGVHFLVMTATPIPRTLAMTVYGDLDVSIIDEMPPGRSPIQTRVVFESKKKQALDFLGEQVAKGRQAYVVYPLIEESDKLELKNATDEFEKLKILFPQFQIELLHGRMKSEEKDEVMERFRRGETQILVSTTVIEVGVDVPNANLILVEHAERFGLSQLHQLRGRVGRGSHKSYCIFLLGYAIGEDARTRTEFLETTTDGFKVAEFDLEIRGPGEFLGTKQSGLSGFKMAHLVKDSALLYKARERAFSLLKEDPKLERHQNQATRAELIKLYGGKGQLAFV